MYKFVVASDYHFPYQDENAVKQLLVFIKDYKPDCVILNGDVLDFYCLSRFDKDPERIGTLQDELNQVSKFLKDLREVCKKKTRIVYVLGNHEDRLRKYIWTHNELAGLENLQLEKLIDTKTPNVEVVKRFKLDSLLFTHGSIVRKYSAYSANAELDKYQTSGSSGHTHRLGSYFKSGYSGNREWHESGCMCRLDAQYLDSEPNWQQGFLVGLIEDNPYASKDEFAIYPIKINSNGKFLFPKIK